MNIRKIQFLFSILFFVVYALIIAAILYVEVSDNLNMKKGENSMMGEVTILLGVLTGGVGQILNFWFKDFKKSGEEKIES